MVYRFATTAGFERPPSLCNRGMPFNWGLGLFVAADHDPILKPISSHVSKMNLRTYSSVGVGAASSSSSAIRAHSIALGFGSCAAFDPLLDLGSENLFSLLSIFVGVFISCAAFNHFLILGNSSKLDCARISSG